MVDPSLEQVQGEEWMPEVAWRIVGASESPIKSSKLMQLISGVVSKQVPNDQRDRTIGTISRWYETRDGRSVLASDTKDEVDELVLCGAAQLLHKSQPGSNNDTLFWAIGAVDPETAVEMILASWSSEQIDSLLEYATGVLKVLCENDNVIDPSDAVGFKVESGKAYIDPNYKQQRIKTFQRTEWHRPRMYYGVSRVVQILMTVRPDRFANLVEKADHPTVQRWALFLVSRRSATGRLQALDWLKDEPSEPLIAIAIVHALECLRELGWEAEHPGRSQEEREEAFATASRLLSGLVIQLAQYGPAESVRWTAELYKHGVLLTGINRREGNYNVGEELEDLCVDSLVDLVRRSWNSDLREALRSGESWGDITNQTLPLGMVAHKVSGDYPDRATEIARIVLGKHAMHMNNLMANNDRAYYTLTENRAIKWMRGLGAALAIALPESDTPLDWAVMQCSELPLSTWDADDLPEKFRLGGDVAQIQLSVAMYAVVARYEAGHAVDSEMVRNLAAKAWEHCHFLRQQERFWLEEPELDELAARVAVGLGNPNEVWLMDQACNRQIGPRGLWALVDACTGIEAHTNLLHDMGSSIAAQYRNTRSTGLATLKYLAMIWQLLEAADAAVETAEIMMEYHQKAMERGDYVVAMNLLVLAARQKEVTPRVKRTIRYIYDYLWRNRTPSEELELRKSVDALLA